MKTTLTFELDNEDCGIIALKAGAAFIPQIKESKNKVVSDFIHATYHIECNADVEYCQDGTIDYIDAEIIIGKGNVLYPQNKFDEMITRLVINAMKPQQP